MPLGRNSNGSMLGEALVALVVIAVLLPVALRLHMKSVEARIERASLERMSELAGELLGEARLGDCAQYDISVNPPAHGTACFAPLDSHGTLEADPLTPKHLTDFTVTDLNGRKVHFRVVLLDTYSPLQYGIPWPVRTVTITDSTGRLTLARSTVGRPS